MACSYTFKLNWFTYQATVTICKALRDQMICELTSVPWNESMASKDLSLDGIELTKLGCAQLTSHHLCHFITRIGIVGWWWSRSFKWSY